MSNDLKVNLVAGGGVVAFLYGVYEIAGLGSLLIVLGGGALAYSWITSRVPPAGRG